VVRATVATAVALLILAAASVATGGGSGDDGLLSLPPARALDAAPCPDAGDFDVPPVRDRRLQDARQGSFHVFGPRPTRLRVPIDWSTDPLGAHRYRWNLQKLRFLAPLLSSCAAAGGGVSREIGSKRPCGGARRRGCGWSTPRRTSSW
jgi:hypothetical protein